MHEIPGYDIHRSLKDGPTSAVYLARRESDDESVVLKVFKPQLPSSARIARFRHEFEISDASRYLDLALEYVRDDGAVI